MDSTASSNIDPNALTFRNYLKSSQQPSASPSILVIPPYPELAALQQELLYLAEKANIRLEKYTGELSRLDGASHLAQSKDSSLSSTPTSSTSAAAAQGASTGANTSANVARSSASPNASSPSSHSNTSKAGGSSGAQAQSSGGNSPAIVKLGVVTLKLKRSDAAESSKTDDELSSASTPNTIKIRTGTPSLAQDGFVKKKRKRELEDDSEYSEDDRVALPKSKRSDDYLLNKTGRSMSPQPVKLNPNRHGTPKAVQNRTGDKGHSSSHQKKKKNSEKTDKAQKPKSQEVQEDFSKVKVANQIPIQTFWASMDPYFRPFTEADRAVLEEERDNVTPLLIPPLGKHYLDAWTEEDRALLPFDGFESRRSSVDIVKDTAPSRNTVYNQPFELTDENIDQDEVSCGPLTERIICSLIAEEVVDPKEIKDDDEQVEAEASLSTTPAASQSNARNYAELEERIKRELRYIGLLGNEEIDWDAREDDEISITLRSLQKELREVMKVNKSRKQRLLGLVNNHLAYQEYNTILDDLDKQVEQGYLKRFRMTKSKKKKTSTPKSLSENALSSMDRRRRFVQGVGPIFPPENYTIPTKSIYQDELEPKASIGAPQSYRQLNGLP
ncbi:Transcriptional regulator [Entomortierella lignicola]|nr:Transcriptional regulator [Entomortierella lignicola]